MSTATLNTQSGFHPAAAIGRHPDIAVLVLAFPVFVLADLPLLAYFGAAAIWIVQAVAQVVVDRKLDGNTDPKQVLALSIGTAMARAMFSAFAILALGIATDDETGLSAVLMIFTLFTAYLAGKFFRHAAGLDAA